ncbi:MAG: bifunctional hydroxymethylpyrimidine kinase/phosphomethylpyrimidine kinase [Candidatus Sumerlaeaceae bacterium]|nr:bifunctional hydroxymethylpyrimidine kinase/phosphomethylpyrimidine kinase [Candidatus Sumerlaeaceae bacterium]
MTIAGSDSGGGAGIQGDLKTFTVLGTYGMSIITALTAQNTREVRDVLPVPADFVRGQLETVLDDIPCDAIKTGMLANAEIVRVVSETLRQHPTIPVVVDPVMVSSTGARLLTEDAVRSMIESLIPLATVLTPNAPETAVLVGNSIESLADVKSAATELLKMGPKAVLVKGGDVSFEDGVVIDILALQDFDPVELRSSRAAAGNCHGSGCALAAAICVGLARDLPISEAIQLGRSFVLKGIQRARTVGSGAAPVNHLAAAEGKMD